MKTTKTKATRLRLLKFTPKPSATPSLALLAQHTSGVTHRLLGAVERLTWLAEHDQLESIEAVIGMMHNLLDALGAPVMPTQKGGAK